MFFFQTPKDWMILEKTGKQGEYPGFYKRNEVFDAARSIGEGEQLQSYFDSKVQTGQKLLISDKIKYYVSCHFREPDLVPCNYCSKA